MNHDLIIDYLATSTPTIICLSPFILLGALICLLLWMRRRRSQRSSLPTSVTAYRQSVPSHYTLIDTSASVDPARIKKGAAFEPATQTVIPKIAVRVRPAKLTRQQKAAIVRQARLDYEHARGYVHHQILEKARIRLEMQLNQTQENIKRWNQKVRTLEEQRQQELIQQLEYHLIHDRLDEVAGIGSALKHRILTTLHARRLHDLQRAHLVSGVGQNRQYDINQWIRRYTQRLPQMVNEPFPGRDTILKTYQSQIAEAQRALAEQRTQQTVLAQKLALIEPHYAWLHAIDAKTFERAALGLSADMAELARYTVGLFAEWEPIPAWFKEIADEGAG